MRIPGMVQTARYGDEAWTFSLKPIKEGAKVSGAAVDGTPEVQFYSPAGAAIGTGVELTEDGTTGWWEAVVDLSATGTWQLGVNYQAEMSYVLAADSVTYYWREYFDVVRWPFNEPIIATDDIETEYADWTQVRPTSWDDWTPAIKVAHRRLCNDLRQMRDNEDAVLRPSMVLDRNQLFTLELAYVESVIKDRCRFSKEERDLARENVNAELANFSRFQMDRDQDLVVDAEDDGSTGSSFFR